MTEEEARQRWCPFVRVVTNGVVVNRDNPDDGLITNADAAAHCIGSACMAWRWNLDRPSSERAGYCGLAGKP